MRPNPITTAPTCRFCGTPLTPGGAAIACGTNGRATTIPLAAYCRDRQCRIDRDNAAIEDAIARGIITR